MTQRQCKELLREEIIPVILGNGTAAHRLALKLQWQYGISSLVCAPRRSAWDLLDPAADFFPLVESESRLVREQLCDLASRYEGCLLLLIPSREEERTRLGDDLASLEPFYVITDAERVGSLLAPCLR